MKCNNFSSAMIFSYPHRQRCRFHECSSRERDGFAQEVSRVIGRKNMWAGDEGSKPQELGWLEVDWVNIILFSLPISEVIVTEPSNVCIRTVLHECILTICTSHAALSETGAKRCLCKEPPFWFQSAHRLNPTKPKAKCSTDPKLLASTRPNK